MAPQRCQVRYILAGIFLIYITVTLHLLSSLSPHHTRQANSVNRQTRLEYTNNHQQKQHGANPIIETLNETSKISVIGNKFTIKPKLNPIPSKRRKQQPADPKTGTVKDYNRTSVIKNQMLKKDKLYPIQSKKSVVDNGSFKKIGSIFVFSAFLDERETVDQELPIIRIMAITKIDSEEDLVCGYSESFHSNWILAQKYEMCENHGRRYGGYIFSCNVPADIPLPPSKVYLQSLADLSQNQSQSILQSAWLEVVPIKARIIRGLITSSTETQHTDKQAGVYKEGVYRINDIYGHYMEPANTEEPGTVINSQEIFPDNQGGAAQTSNQDNDYRLYGSQRDNPDDVINHMSNISSNSNKLLQLYNTHKQRHRPIPGTSYISKADNIPPKADNIPPNKDNIPPNKDNIPPNKDNIPPNKDNIQPNKDNIPPNTDNIPPNTDNIPPPDLTILIQKPERELKKSSNLKFNKGLNKVTEGDIPFYNHNQSHEHQSDNLQDNLAIQFIEAMNKRHNFKALVQTDKKETGFNVNEFNRKEPKFEDMVKGDSADSPQAQATGVTIALCVPALYGNVQLSQLIQFIEIYRILGVSQFFFYKLRVSRSVNELLAYYMADGTVTVIDWTLPNTLDTPRQLWNYGQIVNIQDCLYRTMANFDYVAFVDIDEVIIPKLDTNWPEMLRRLETEAINNEPASITAAFSFHSAFFDPNYGPHSSSHSANELSFLQSIHRSKTLGSVRTKLIVKPVYIMEMGIHHVSSTVNVTHEVVIADVDPTIALLHHYRECTTQSDPQVDCDRNHLIQDDTVLRYERELTRRYYKVLENNVRKFTKLATVQHV